jgi:hypothetical protein
MNKVAVKTSYCKDCKHYKKLKCTLKGTYTPRKKTCDRHEDR